MVKFLKVRISLACSADHVLTFEVCSRRTSDRLSFTAGQGRYRPSRTPSRQEGCHREEPRRSLRISAIWPCPYLRAFQRAQKGLCFATACTWCSVDVSGHLLVPTPGARAGVRTVGPVQVIKKQSIKKQNRRTSLKVCFWETLHRAGHMASSHLK